MTARLDDRAALRGTLLALASALAFGTATPLVQHFGAGTGAFTTAACLYAGASLAGISTRSRGEAPLRALHAPRIAAVAVLGAVLAPALLAWGLARTSGTTASLMLNLEAVFTLALARLVRGEHVGTRVAVAALVVLAGGALLVLDRGGPIGHPARALGLAAVAGASLSWALDNTLSKPIAMLDPSAVVAAKGTLGVILSVACAGMLGESRPTAFAFGSLVLVGATGYGLSLHLYLRAQRVLGAGRTASVFASAPFCGAFVAWLLGEPAGWLAAAGASAMILGVVLHATERHAHPHVHEAIVHEHPHCHDDGHHDHVHDPMPTGEHTHAHHHERVEHSHAHLPDIHHEHEH